MHATNACPSEGIISKPEDIVFTKADANLVHHPHEDALVVTGKIANSLVHRILVDNGSAVNILCWDAYQKIGLTGVHLYTGRPKPNDLTSIQVHQRSREPRRNHQAASHPRRIFSGGDDRD